MARRVYALHFADDGQRGRWEAAARREGKSLAQFIRDAVEERVAGRAPLSEAAPAAVLRLPLPGKRSYEADPKVRPRPGKVGKSGPHPKDRGGKLG